MQTIMIELKRLHSVPNGLNSQSTSFFTNLTHITGISRASDIAHKGRQYTVLAASVQTYL